MYVCTQEFYVVNVNIVFIKMYYYANSLRQGYRKHTVAKHSYARNSHIRRQCDINHIVTQTINSIDLTEINIEWNLNINPLVNHA